MNIEIRTTNVEVSSALAEHVTTMVGAAVRPQRDHLVRVLVRICDVAGPEGRPNVHCHVVARLRGRSLAVHDRAEDAFNAVTRASARLSELVLSLDDRNGAPRTTSRYTTWFQSGP